MKRNILLCVILLSVAAFGFSADLIDFGNSNQYNSTMGYETNEYDWLLNPLDFDKIKDSTIFFSLDSYGSQFGTDTAGNDGFRGGWALEGKNFTSLYALNYYTATNVDTEVPEEIIEYDFTTYDQATGQYAIITETVDFDDRSYPYHSLMAHFGGNLDDGPLDFDIQAWWKMDRQVGNSYSYSNTYSNTASATEDTLTTKGDLEEESWNLIDSDNIVAIEPEIGLTFGDIQTLIALGVGLYNMGTDDDSYTTTTTTYTGGVDATAMDSTTTSSKTGSYYGSGSTCFAMGTNNPSYVRRTLLNLDTKTVLPLDDDMELTLPVFFNMTLYPSTLSTVAQTIDVDYDDSYENGPQEYARDTTTTTTTLAVGHDILFGLGGELTKTITPSEDSALHLGAYANFSMGLYQDTRTKQYSEQTQQDNNGDGAYITAGTDTDTTTTESGYEIQNREISYDITLGLPIAVSFSPAKRLTFHAGVQTYLNVSLSDSDTLTTGSSSYLYETFTDNLESANSIEQRQKDGNSSEDTPTSEFDYDFDMSVYGSFGFTLDITEKFCIDAVAIGATNMETYSFSLTGIYSY